MLVKINGVLLSSLYSEQVNSDGDKEGFLLGNISNVRVDSITDDDTVKQVDEKTYYCITSIVPAEPLLVWNNSDFSINHDRIISMGFDLKNIIGWYKTRNNTTLSISLRERHIHNNFQAYLQSLKFSKNFKINPLFLLAVTRSDLVNPHGTTKGLYTSEFQCFLKEDYSNAFKSVPVSILNLGSVAKNEYSFESDCMPIVKGGIFSEVIENFRSNEINAVKEVTLLSQILFTKLKEVCEKLKRSEDKLAKELEEYNYFRQKVSTEEECRIFPAMYEAILPSNTHYNHSSSELQNNTNIPSLSSINNLDHSKGDNKGCDTEIDLMEHTDISLFAVSKANILGECSYTNFPLNDIEQGKNLINFIDSEQNNLIVKTHHDSPNSTDPKKYNLSVKTAMETELSSDSEITIETLKHLHKTRKIAQSFVTINKKNNNQKLNESSIESSFPSIANFYTKDSDKTQKKNHFLQSENDKVTASISTIYNSPKSITPLSNINCSINNIVDPLKTDASNKSNVTISQLGTNISSKSILINSKLNNK